MKDWIKFKGIKSSEYGMAVLTQPPITRPAERVAFTDVPGRSGSLAQVEGEDVYDDMILTAECYVKDETRIREICAWLKGAGEVEFANREGYSYEAFVVNQIPFEQIVRGKPNKRFAVNFRCKPLILANEAKTIAPTNGQYINNEGTANALPVITVTGSGATTLMVGQTIIELENIEGEITIDSAIEEAYSGDVLANDKMRGEFPVLPAGLTAISWVGDATGVVVTYRERYIV